MDIELFKSKKMTLAELENFVNSKENYRFCYSYENNPTDINYYLPIVVCFDKICFGHHTQSIALRYEREENNRIYKNRLAIYRIKSIKVYNCGVGESITFKTYDGQKYTILFNHD